MGKVPTNERKDSAPLDNEEATDTETKHTDALTPVEVPASQEPLTQPTTDTPDQSEYTNEQV